MKKGFTLIEITIVVSIIAILGTIFIANYRGGEKQFALKRSAYKMAQDLRGAQEMAMSARPTPASFDGAFPKGGYGIYLEKGADSYILFADCDGTGLYNANKGYVSCAEADQDNPFSKGEKLEEFYLEEGIYIKEIFKGIVSMDKLSITVFPPDPTITINADALANSARIHLTFGGSSEKIISVNKSGLIEIQ